MHRRAFVTGSVAVLSAAVAGCAAVTGSRRLSVDPFDPDHVAYTVDELGPKRRAAVNAIRDDGAEVTYGYRRLNGVGDKGYVGLDGAFYRITTENTGERAIGRDVLVARADDRAVAAANAVDPKDVYGEDDRRRILHAADPGGDRERASADAGVHIYADDEIHIYADDYVFRDVDPDETDLLYEPEHRFVELTLDPPFGRARVFRLQIGAGTLLEPEYTTTLEPIGDAEELARRLDEEGLVHHLDGGGLTAEQRDALEAAIEGGTYSEPRPFLGDEEPFGGLPLAPTNDPETDRPYRVVRYDGEYYVWTVDYTDGNF